MQEIFPGISRWTVTEPERRLTKSAVMIQTTNSRWLVDPVLDQRETTKFENLEPITGLILTTSSHLRDMADFRSRLKTEVYASPQTKEQVKDKLNIDQAVADGAELPGGIRTLLLAGTTGGELALFVPTGGGAMVIADAIMADANGNLMLIPERFVPDRRPLLADLEKLLRFDFEAIIPSHGEPVLAGAREQLRCLIEDF